MVVLSDNHIVASFDVKFRLEDTDHFWSSEEIDHLKINTMNISVTRSGKSAHIL